MDITSILGLFIGLGGILLGNLIEGGHLGSLVQGPAAVIVFAGTFGAVFVSHKKDDLQQGWRMLRSAFRADDESVMEKSLNQIVDWARTARKESILALEPKVAGIGDEFTRDVLRTVVDGLDPHTIRDIFDRRIEVEEDKALSGAKVWTDAGSYAPTIGIIGAVLGLIHVMGNLSDTSKLGSGIATAFVATIYGVASANLIFLPLGNKLKKKAMMRIREKEMILDGCLSILAGLNPVIIENKLRAYLSKTEMK